MNEQDKQAFEQWADRNGFYDIEHDPHTGGECLRMYDEVAWESWQAALEYARGKQEPVAWIDEFGNVFPKGAQRGSNYLNEPMKPLYTHPAQAVAQEPIHFRAVLCSEQQNQSLGVVPKVVGFVDKKAAEQFILEKRDFQGWRYSLEPLYTEAPAVAVDEQFAVLIKKANDQAEHFEREWYLRGDELEALEQVNAQLLEALKELMYARTDKAEGMADAAIAQAEAAKGVRNE